jgi:acyl-CoA dehydrogenase
MIDLDLTKGDEAIIKLAHEQALVYRKYAKANDHMMDFTRPDYENNFFMPEEKDFIHVRDLAKRRVDELSGLPIIETLIYLEESWGFKPLIWRGADWDNLNVSLAGKLIEKVGTAEQCESWKNKYMAWGMSEPGGGADPASMRTAAVFDSATQEWVINGEKTFSSNATHADGILVMCRCHGPEGDEGISLIIVEKGTPGYDIGPQMDKMGLRNWDTVAVSFMDVRVPADQRLKGNLKDALSIFNGTRAIIAGQALGYARVALDFIRERLDETGNTLDYTSDLCDRSALEDRVMRLEALYDATYLTTLHAKWHEQTHGTAKFYPSLAKMKAGMAVRKLLTECMNILGASSSSENYPIEQAFRDARILDIYEGPNEAQKLLIGRTLLGYTAKELN